jgi:hypothetical protein
MMMQSYAKCSLNANQIYSQLEFYYCIPVNCLEKEMRNAWEQSKKNEQENGEEKKKNQILETLKPCLVPNDSIFIR